MAGSSSDRELNKGLTRRGHSKTIAQPTCFLASLFGRTRIGLASSAGTPVWFERKYIHIWNSRALVPGSGPWFVK
jgi:hypothetical protein